MRFGLQMGQVIIKMIEVLPFAHYELWSSAVAIYHQRADLIESTVACTLRVSVTSKKNHDSPDLC